MKDLFKKIIFALAFLSATAATAQIRGRDFTQVDEYVKGLGSMDSMSMATINNVVINKFTDKIDKARAIYYWIAHNIEYDIKAARTNNTSKNKPDDVLLNRKAVGIGFASLFQDMCSNADIRCLTVDGFVKYKTEQIGEKDIEINHSWAVVQLGLSPEEWYYVDPAFGSGYVDEDMKVFTSYYTDAYFFTDKEVFNQQHYPDNTAWKLGGGPRSKKEFLGLPVVKVAAIELGLKKCFPEVGNLKAKANKAVKFSFVLNATDSISKVELGIGERRKYKQIEIQFTATGNTLNFTHKFEEENAYPVTVFINGREFVTYYVEIE